MYVIVLDIKPAATTIAVKINPVFSVWIDRVIINIVGFDQQPACIPGSAAAVRLKEVLDILARRNKKDTDSIVIDLIMLYDNRPFHTGKTNPNIIFRKDIFFNWKPCPAETQPLIIIFK